MGRSFNASQPIGRYLRAAGLSVNQLYHLTGISYRTLSNYLAGRTAILPRHIQILCDALDCLPSDLLHGQVVGDVVCEQKNDYTPLYG